ncbi:MAG: hypothetical protein RR416_06135 [Clostridia bacterium]
MKKKIVIISVSTLLVLAVFITTLLVFMLAPKANSRACGYDDIVTVVGKDINVLPSKGAFGEGSESKNYFVFFSNVLNGKQNIVNAYSKTLKVYDKNANGYDMTYISSMKYLDNGVEKVERVGVEIECRKKSYTSEAKAMFNDQTKVETLTKNGVTVKKVIGKNKGANGVSFLLEGNNEYFVYFYRFSYENANLNSAAENFIFDAITKKVA